MALGLGLSVLIAVGATCLYTGLMWAADRHEKEPWGLVLAALFWGALPAVFLAVVGELLAGISLPEEGTWGAWVQAGLLGPVIEELAKALMLWLLLRFGRLEFDGPVDGIVYAAVIGFGFAMTENVLYFWQSLKKRLARVVGHSVFPARGLRP